MDNIEQSEVLTFKSSVVVKTRLEKLAQKEGISGAATMRNLINREYNRVFGEE
jgi:hypothetical protein